MNLSSLSRPPVKPRHPMETHDEEMNIVTMALAMSTAMSRLTEQAREYYYAVMLSGQVCPDCSGNLTMVREGLCMCAGCGRQFDPTVEFEHCQACGGEPKLNARRYSCGRCSADVPSRFLFDGLVFDAEYFRQKMAESRQRKQELRERVRLMLAGSHSGPASTDPIDLTSVVGLLGALDALVADCEVACDSRPLTTFNLNRYQAHVQEHLRPYAISLEQIPPLSENTRLDRIWRFIAIIFLAHAGVLDAWQRGPDIMVIQRETDPEGQGVPGDFEEADGIA